MKQLIRHGVFETNSSSCHSISIARGAKIYDSISPNEDGYIIVTPGEYGWEQESYCDSQGKLNYMYTFIMGENDDSQRQHYLKMVEEVVVEHTGCKGLVYDTLDDKYYPNGYVDHQSAIYEGGSALEALKSRGSLKELLFNPDSYVETDNDNH